MDVGGIEVGLGGGALVVFGYGEGLQHAVEVLHVRDVAAKSDDSGFVEDAEAVDVSETGEGAVRCCGRDKESALKSKAP